MRYKDVLLPNGVKISSLIFRYCHLAEIYVNVNEKFSQGKKIAKRGATGKGAQAADGSPRPHLHLEVDNDPPAGAASDPMYTPSEGNGYEKADAIAKMTDPMKVFFRTREQAFYNNQNSWTTPAEIPPYIDEV